MTPWGILSLFGVDTERSPLGRAAVAAAKSAEASPEPVQKLYFGRVSTQQVGRVYGPGLGGSMSRP